MSGNNIVALRGKVSGIKHYKPETQFCVFTAVGTKNSKGKSFSCFGVVESMPEVGSIVEVYGYLSPDPKYPGTRLRLTSFSTICGDDAGSIAKFLMSFAKYLGYEKSTRIAQAFGGDIERILEEEPHRLLEVEGIGESILRNITEGWEAQKGVRKVKIFLIKMGLSDAHIRYIIRKHGDGRFEENLKKDPYILTHDGISFSACDTIAEKLEIPPDSDIRYRAFIRNAVHDLAHSDGHMCVKETSVFENLCKFNSDVPKRKFDNEFIKQEVFDNHLKYLLENGYLIRRGEMLYDINHYFAEASVSKKLVDMIKAPASNTFNHISYDKFVANYEAEESLSIPGFKLAEQQSESIAKFLSSKVLVITGQPGTGKTTIIKAFVKILRGNNIRYELMAPTGVASKRLSHAAKSQGYTIHKSLGAKLGGSWEHDSSNQLDTDAVIIDEVSMVDTFLLNRLLEALPTRTKLVFVGDVDQLPSVGAGYVLHDLINSGVIPVVRLNKIQRQAEKSGIVQLAHAINRGDVESFTFGSSFKESDVSFYSTGSDESSSNKIINMFAKKLSEANKPGLFQILTPRNEGPLSVMSINNLLQESLNPDNGQKSAELSKESKIRVGDRILVIRNNYNLNIFNGDIGKCMAITSKSMFIRIENPDGTYSDAVEIPLEEVSEHIKLGYGLTVHKSQGSEYQYVIIPLLKSHGSRLLQRNLIYTAVTRAKKKVIFVGDPIAFYMAVENADIQSRNTSLIEMLKEYHDNGIDPTKVVRDFGKNCSNYSNIERLLFPKMAAAKDEAASFDDV